MQSEIHLCTCCLFIRMETTSDGTDEPGKWIHWSTVSHLPLRNPSRSLWAFSQLLGAEWKGVDGQQLDAVTYTLEEGRSRTNKWCLKARS